MSDSDDLNVDSDDENVKRGVTQGAGALGKFSHHDNSNLEEELESMDKKELIKLITNYGKFELRETNMKIAMLTERKNHFEKAIDELEKSVAAKNEKAEKYRIMSKDPERAKKRLLREIKENKEKMAELQVKVDEFEAKKKKLAVEQVSAKKEITKKLVTRVYKYLEKESDNVIVTLLETFTALLRNRPNAKREDVELYLKSFKGLEVALNKVDPRDISGTNAKIYSESINTIRAHFNEEGPYLRYIPFLVYVHQTCRIVLLSVEEKEIEFKIKLLADENKDKEKEIDEIETFEENVEEVVDHRAQASTNEEQMKLLSNHYELLKLRSAKLQKYSKLFEKYYYEEVRNPSKLDSNLLEKIDKMDDLHKVKIQTQTVGNLSKSVTKSARELAVPTKKNGLKHSDEDSKGDDQSNEEEDEGDDEENEGDEEENEGDGEDNEEESEPAESEEQSRTQQYDEEED